MFTAATPVSLSIAEESLSTWDLSFENRTDVFDIPEYCSAIDESANEVVSAAEKIEKLTKYLHDSTEKSKKKWKNYELKSMASLNVYGWMDLQPKRKKLDCPKCLWQCGTIYVNSEFLQKKVCCGEVSFE